MPWVCVQEELYLQRVAQLDEITTERDKFKRTYEDLRKQRLNEFMTGFNMITNKLKENYQMLTLGGDAELELVDSLDPFSEGIMFRLETLQRSDSFGASLFHLNSELLFILSVRPPKKSWKKIFNLSGGEKTLSSLALVFALHHYKPTPLYFMDEIDAALDFKNVSIVACYIYVSMTRFKQRMREPEDQVLNVSGSVSLSAGTNKECSVHHHLTEEQHV